VRYAPKELLCLFRVAICPVQSKIPGQRPEISWRWRDSNRPWRKCVCRGQGSFTPSEQGKHGIRPVPATTATDRNSVSFRCSCVFFVSRRGCSEGARFEPRDGQNLAGIRVLSLPPNGSTSGTACLIPPGRLSALLAVPLYHRSRRAPEDAEASASESMQDESALASLDRAGLESLRSICSSTALTELLADFRVRRPASVSSAWRTRWCCG
jgi:hypothetical protein